MPYALMEQTLALNPLVPHLPSAKQYQFLELECLDAMYGGAAGGGKSDALLMGAVQFWEVPGYAALILRRTLADLKKPGGLLDRSREWFGGSGVGARYRSQDHRWWFPSGATLQFGYCEHEKDVEQYRSSEFQFIGADEGTQFTEFQLRFLFSRLRRRKNIPVPLRYRIGTNPGGPSHEFIKRRYISPGTPGKAFVPARLDDNPGLDRETYLQSLAELDPLTRAQLEAGDWDAVAGGRFQRAWFARRWTRRGDYVQVRDPDGRLEYEFVPYDPAHAILAFMTVDPAASTSRRADYTVVSTWILTTRADLIWLGCDRFKAEIPDIVPRIAAAYLRTGRPYPSFVGIESIGANSGVFQLACRATHPILPARPLDKGDRDKLVHATKGITLAATGRVILPTDEAAALSSPAFPLEDVLSELVRFTGDEKQDDHDDVVDTLSYAAEGVEDPPPADGREAVPHVLGG